MERAVSLVEETAREGKRVFTLGPIIHNRHVVGHFEKMGVAVADTPDQLPDGCAVIIRSHGVPRAVFEALEARDVEIIDATCPFVKRIHALVMSAEREGRTPVIIGNRTHPEVVAIAGWCSHPKVFESAEELAAWLEGNPKNRDLPISMVSQTTSTKKYGKVAWKS